MQGGGMSEEMMAGMCPMRVEGTKVTASDVDGGIALAFATSTVRSNVTTTNLWGTVVKRIDATA